jgi:hypothetical protein
MAPARERLEPPFFRHPFVRDAFLKRPRSRSRRAVGPLVVRMGFRGSRVQRPPNFTTPPRCASGERQIAPSRPVEIKPHLRTAP